MKLELLDIFTRGLSDPSYGVIAQLNALRAAAPVFGVAVPEIAAIPIVSAPTDERVSLGMGPINLPAIVLATGLSPTKAGGEISQGIRIWPSVTVVASWVVSDANAAAAWTSGDYIETAIIRAVAQAILDAARIQIAGISGGIQIQICNGVTSGPVMKALRDSSGILVHAVSHDLVVYDLAPTLIP